MGSAVRKVGGTPHNFTDCAGIGAALDVGLNVSADFPVPAIAHQRQVGFLPTVVEDDDLTVRRVNGETVRSAELVGVVQHDGSVILNAVVFAAINGVGVYKNWSAVKVVKAP